MIRQPVVITGGNRVVFANQAAINLFGENAERMPAPIIALAQDETVIGSRTAVEVEGAKYSVFYEPIIGYTAIIFDSVQSGIQLYEQILKIALAVNREFRMPLTMMFSAATLLAEDPQTSKNKKASKYLSIINQNSYRLLRIINNIFDLASYLQGDSKLNRMLMDLNEVCLGVVDTLEPIAGEMGVRLSFESNPEKIMGSFDADRIERMLYNMLSNSLKHTPSGGQITVRTVLQDKRVFLTVTDTGEGISEKVLPYVYDRFSMIEKSDENPSGFGLGLSIVKAIAELHGGAVLLESRRGEGTKITVSLPVETNRAEVFREANRHVDYAGGFSRMLLELAEVIGSEYYSLGPKTADKMPEL